MFKLHVREFTRHLEARIHEFETRRKDDVVALRREVADHAFGVRHAHHVFNVARLHLAAELLFNQFAGFVVLLTPTFVGARTRVKPGGLDFGVSGCGVPPDQRTGSGGEHHRDAGFHWDCPPFKD